MTGTAGRLRGFLVASKQRTQVVEVLKDGPKTPATIARLTKLHRSNVSRALSELQNSQVVYCLSPELRKGKLYGLAPESAIGLQMRDETWELLPEAPAAEMEQQFTPRVRGEAMLAGIAATVEVLGPEAVVRLSRACEVNLFAVQGERWYAAKLHHRFLSQLGEIFEGGLDLCREVGRRSIAYLPYLQRFLADRDVDLMAFAERAPLAHDYYFNFGRFEVLPHEGGFEARQFDMFPTPAFCAARAGNYEGVLEAKGFVHQVREPRCEAQGDPYCAFQVEVKGLAGR